MKTPRVSDAEWEVMKIAWRNAPFTAHDVKAALPPGRDWTLATIKTLLNRLHSKGALKFVRSGKAYQYTPAVTEERLRAAETVSFLDRVFDGLASPMIAHLANAKKLTDADLAELERIVREGRKQS